MGRITEWHSGHAAILDHHVNYIDKLAQYEDIGEPNNVVPIIHSHWIYKKRHRKSYHRYTGYDSAGEEHTITVREETDCKEPYCARCGAQAAESFMYFCPFCGAMMDEPDTFEGE